MVILKTHLGVIQLSKSTSPLDTKKRFNTDAKSTKNNIPLIDFSTDKTGIFDISITDVKNKIVTAYEK